MPTQKPYTFAIAQATTQSEIAKEYVLLTLIERKDEKKHKNLQRLYPIRVLVVI
jgi:hypothetical protein